MSAVDLDHIDKQFAAGARAVSDLSLHIDDGEIVVLVGPSGCGKSTVLRMLAGLEAPTAGEIRIAGKRVNELSPQQRNVAMVFQDYALYPFMTVRDNLEFPLKMRRLDATERQRRVATTADLLGIGALLDRLPKQLSGGQRQRVAMGRALVREPAVSLLDEPLSNLDAKLRVQVRAEIAELQRRTHTTMMYVTHDQIEAMTLGHRVAVLDRGVLQQVAPPRELYDRPANVFVAGFIGNPPMNLIPTVVQPQDGEHLAVAVGTRRLRLPAALPVKVGDAVTVGVRPEDLDLAIGNDGEGILATVRYAEYLGHETLVYAAIEGAGALPIVARIAGTRVYSAGQTLGLDVTALHVFAADGQRLQSQRS